MGSPSRPAVTLDLRAESAAGSTACFGEDTWTWCIGVAARDIPLLERALISEGAGAQFNTPPPLPEGPLMSGNGDMAEAGLGTGHPNARALVHVHTTSAPSSS